MSDPAAAPFPLIGFDLDGTLLDTAADIAAAVDHVLAEEGRDPLGEARVRTMIGGGSRHMLGQALAASGGCDDALLDRLLPRLLAWYGDHVAVRTRPYPGCADALDRLRAGGARLAVVTNKVERLAVKVLGATGLIDRFALVIGGDSLAGGETKPSPAPIRAMLGQLGGGRAAFVGDSRYDVEAARAAGLPVVACAFDHDARALGADAVIDRYDQLDAALAGLAGGAA